MSFNRLKSALIRRGGKLTATGEVEFKNIGDTLAFEGTGTNRKNEPVKVKYNGKDFDLSQWLHEETPVLKTGSKIVKNKSGTPTDCNVVVEKILIKMGFIEPGKNKYYGKRPIHGFEIEEIPSDKINIPAEFQKLVEDINRLKTKKDHAERAHESLVEDFYMILGYKKIDEIAWRINNSDILIKADNKNLIVNEVKRDWQLNRHHTDVKKQAYNYALEMGIRFVVMTNGDYYAIFDRGTGYSYEDHFIGDFVLSKMTEDKLQYIDFIRKNILLSYIENFSCASK